MAFRNVKSPKSPLKTNDAEIEHLLKSARKKLENLVFQRAKDQLSELINSEKNVETKERQEMTREKLSQIGAIPKLAFCRPENFRLMRVLGVGSYGKVFLVRLKSHRILPDSLFPNRYPQPNKNALLSDNLSDAWPDGLSENSDLCSKYWLPNTTESMEDSIFRHYYAMKVVPKHLIVNRPNDIHHVQTELRVLKKISHPFLIQFVSCFQTEQKIFFITEYYPGGDMYSLLEQTHRMSEGVALFYLAEILMALQYLHSINIIYRDLKPENVVLELTGHIRLIDFGLSKDMVKPSDNRCRTRCGTVNYMAPEVHLYLGHGRAADFWSLGAFAYDLMCCEFPVKDARYKAVIKFPSHLSKEAVSLFKVLLEKDPNLRLGALVLSDTGTVLSGGADDVKKHPFFARIKDWDRALEKKLTPPWVPDLQSPMDTTYFSPESSKIYPRLSFSSKYYIVQENQKHFENFNCINPNYFH